jgi:hypothetical protein
MNNERIPNDNEDQHSKQIEFQYSSNSHDSLLQSDLDTIDNLTHTNPIFSSIFHSKDSALGLSDDNLNQLKSNELMMFQEQERISSFTTLQDKSNCPTNFQL